MKAEPERTRMADGRTTALLRRRSRSTALSIDTTSITLKEDERQLADILDEYLERLEDGTPVSVDELVAEYPDLETPLREYLSGLSLLNAGIAELNESPFLVGDPDRTRVGDYQLLREVGRGGMGVVYEALQLSLERRVALKVLPFAASLDRRQIIRFETESRAAAQLQHPHIVPVFAVGREDGVHYFAMQFIDGQSVRDTIQDHALAKGRSPTPIFVANLAIQTANALQAAHELGIVHRDIKPSNLLIDKEQHLWVADFGLARTQGNHPHTDVTQTGDVVGTLHYMSPEQARGNSSIADPRSDIYSLGVTLYELLAGQRPFDGESHGEILRQIELGHVPSIRKLNPDVPRDLQNVIMKAMAVEPELRYQTAAEMEADLKRFVEGRPTRARPASRVHVIARWASRNRSVAFSLATTLVGVCLTLAGAMVWQAREYAVIKDKLATTRSTLEQFGLNTAEHLRYVPGATGTRKELLEDLRNHYGALIEASGGGDPELLLEQAITTTKIAQAEREEGNLNGALASYRRAQRDFQMLAQSGGSLNVVPRLANCISNSSVVLLELGDPDSAREEILKAIELQEPLAGNSAEGQLDLAVSLSNLATIEQQRDGDVLEPLIRAAGMAERSLATGSPISRNETLVTLSRILGRLSRHEAAKDTSRSVRWAEKAVSHSAELSAVTDSPQQNQYRSLHAANCDHLAALYSNQNQHDLAIEMYEKAAAQLEAIGNHQDHVVALSNLARSLAATGRTTEELLAYRKAIAVQSGLLLDAPGNLNHVSRLGGLENNLAVALRKGGRIESAMNAYESAVELQHRAWELAPQHLTYYRDSLSRTLFNAGETALSLGRPNSAARYHSRRSELWPTNAEQLFSVAYRVASAVNQMPSGRTRDEWKTQANEVLFKAIDQDRGRRLDGKLVERLSSYLASHKDGNPQTRNHQ